MSPKKVFQTAMISAADLANIKHRCAWKDCTETTPLPDGLPRDWRWMLLYWDRSEGDPNPFRGGVRFDRDAVLCPKHAATLDGLLEDIGQRLDKTEGTA